MKGGTGYCPANCNGAHKVPRELTPAQVERIRREIEAKKKYKKLPDLEPREHFFTCNHCHVVWKASDQHSTDPTRRILGRIEGTWLPWPVKGGGWA